jgi:hypothetical protein
MLGYKISEEAQILIQIKVGMTLLLKIVIAGTLHPIPRLDCFAL